MILDKTVGFELIGRRPNRTAPSSYWSVVAALRGTATASSPVDEPAAHAALEEAAAAVAGVDAVVLPAAGVPAHLAQQSGTQGFARSGALGWRSTGAQWRTLAGTELTLQQLK